MRKIHASGGDHSFAKINSIAGFQARVPLSRYEDMWRDYWQPEFPKLIDCTWPGTIPYFALSSGTTAARRNTSRAHAR